MIPFPRSVFPLLFLGAVISTARALDAPPPSPESDRKFLNSLALGKTDSAEITRLLAALEDPDFLTRERAFAKLSELPQIPDEFLAPAEKSAGPESAHRIAAIRKALADKAWRLRANSLLQKISREATPGFAREIVTALPILESASLGSLAHESLRITATQNDTEFLKGAFDTKNEKLRASIIAVFARLDSPDTIPFLCHALADPNPNNRLESALALGKKANPACVLPLIGLLETPSVVSRHRAVEALRQMTGQHFGIDPNQPAPEPVAEWNAWFKSVTPVPELRAYEPPVPLDLLADGMKGWRFFDQTDEIPAKDPFAPGLALANNVIKMAGKPAFGMASVSAGVLTPLKDPGFLRPPGVFTDYHLTFEHSQVARVSDPFAGFAPGRKGGLGPGAIHFSAPDGALVIAVGDPDRQGRFSGVRIQLNNGQVSFLGEMKERADKGEIKTETQADRTLDPLDEIMWPRTEHVPVTQNWRKMEIVLTGGTLQVFKHKDSEVVRTVTVTGIPQRLAGILIDQKTTHVSFRRLRLLPLK